MNYDAKGHSTRSSLALVLVVCCLVIVVSLVVIIKSQHERFQELDQRWLDQHDRIVVLEKQVERLDGVLDRALDAAAIARAVLEESRQTER